MEQIRELAESGYSVNEIAQELELSRLTVIKHAKNGGFINDIIDDDCYPSEDKGYPL